jgi:hypothetical protein
LSCRAPIVSVAASISAKANATMNALTVRFFR